MDIPRQSSKRKRFLRRALFTVIILGSVLAATVAVSRLEPAAPSVDRSIVWVATVERGDMVREVKGIGNLVPVNIRWTSPDTTGRVEEILVRPGTPVTKDTVILVLSNQELELSTEEARLNVKSAESRYDAKKVEIQQAILNLEAALAGANANYITAKLESEPNEELCRRGALARVRVTIDKIRVEQLAKLKELEEKRLEVQREFARTQMDVVEAELKQAHAQYELKQKQLDALRVRAGIDGVLEQVLAEEGQQVGPGTGIAKVSDPTDLKAVLRVEQNQAREVKIGQRARIDLRNSVLQGHVARIDPAVQEGSVNVDVVLDDPLPEGARPDLSLDGTIEIEKLTDVLHVGRPGFGQPGGTITLFKLDADRKGASRVRVTLGRSSVKTIEVADGLQEGNQVIISEMRDWDNVDRIRLR
jgi:HlyD family secretion protein